jgi:drug/metabolite transporter (DMT)-like permease
VAYIGNFIGFVTMGMSIFILKETPTLFQLLGAGIAITGLRIFYLEAPSANEMVGILFILTGIVAVAYTNNIARKLGLITQNKLSNNIVSTLAILIGGTLTVVSGILLDWPPKISGWNNWAIVLYTGVFSLSIGLTVWNHILRTLRSYEASILGASTVIYTTLLAVLLLGERPALNQIVGIGFMLTGLILVQVRRGKLSHISRLFKRSPAVVSGKGPAGGDQ